jgi:hypothetical protein
VRPRLRVLTRCHARDCVCSQTVCVRPRLRVLTRCHARDCVCSHVATPETACAHRLCVRPRLRVLTRCHARDCVCSHVATPETRACDLHYVSIVSASAVSAAPYVSFSFLRSCLRQTMLIQSSPDGAESPSREPETSLTRCHARDSGVATPEHWAQVQPNTDLFFAFESSAFRSPSAGRLYHSSSCPLSESHAHNPTHECSLPPTLYLIEQPGGRPLSPSESWPVSFSVASALTFFAFLRAPETACAHTMPRPSIGHKFSQALTSEPANNGAR